MTLIKNRKPQLKNTPTVERYIFSRKRYIGGNLQDS